MPKYTLIYFEVKARAEISRLIFAAAGQEYEDRRIQEFEETDYGKVFQMKPEDRKFTEQWLELKQKVPFAQLPILEVDGIQIAQSKVIALFLAKRLGLAGNNDLDAAKAAMIAEAVEDVFMMSVFKIFAEKDEEAKAAEAKKYIIETLPKSLAMLEKQVGESGYFVGDKLSYADLALFYNNEWLGMVKTEIDWSKFPKLKAVYDNVEKNPGIAKWMKERPNTMI